MQSTTYVCMAHMHKLHLMTPQGHLVHLAMVYGQLSHLCGKIKQFQNKFSIFYLTNLGLLDNTSQRKLAHIQRLILLNYYFNSITDIPVGTFSLAICDQSVLLVPNLFYLILHFSRTQLLACSLEKYLHLVLAPRSTTIQLKHGCKQQFLAYWTALWRSPSLLKSMFSHFSDE